MEFTIIGNPLNRRVTAFQEALVEMGQAPAQLVTYLDLIQGRVNLAEVVKPHTILRIESPERDFEVEKALLTLGAQASDPDENEPTSFARCSIEEIERLDFDKGAILFPRQWFLGYRTLLLQIQKQLAACPPHLLMNDPENIAVMFDKPACHALLEAHGVAVPASLGKISSYEELLGRMKESGWNRVFIKLAHGSSASGVVAFQISGTNQQAITTVEMIKEAVAPGPATGSETSIIKGRAEASGPKLYNSRRLKIYREPVEISTLINALCQHRVHVERWLPKAGIQNHIFDLRVVVIGGSIRHTVVRLSQSPLTNLHLSNERGSFDLIKGRLKPEHWAAAEATCLKVMHLFPRSLYAGLDLMITSDYRRHAILEVNAFGDLLYDTLYEGKDTYTTEIEAVLKLAKDGAGVAVDVAQSPGVGREVVD